MVQSWVTDQNITINVITGQCPVKSKCTFQDSIGDNRKTWHYLVVPTLIFGTALHHSKEVPKEVNYISKEADVPRQSWTE
jgi:hypothetical protein